MRLVTDEGETVELKACIEVQSFPVIMLRGNDRVTEISFFERDVSQGLTEFVCQLMTTKGRFEGLGLSPMMAFDDALKSYFYT